MASEAPSGVGIVVADRLVAEVAARHHERVGYGRVGTGHGMEQQVVDGACRAGARRRAGCRAPRDGVSAQSSRRRAAARSAAAGWSGARPRGSSISASRFGRGEVADHDRERLVGPALALPQQRGHGVVGHRVAGQVVATEPLDRHDRAVGQRPLRRRDGCVGACVDGGRVARTRTGGRTRRTRAVGRGTAGRRGRGTRRRRPGTARSPPSSCWAGRTGAGHVIVKRGPQLVQLMNG